jgi:hypothetical protein
MYENNMEEQWKEIEGFPNYIISNLGNLKNRKFNKYKKPSNYGNGYKRILLHNKEETKALFIHRLVGFAFIPNPDNKPYINHKDNDPSNNHVNNLEWNTQKENMQHMLKQGRRAKDFNKGTSNGRAKLDWVKVNEIRESNLTQGKLAKLYSVSIYTIYSIVNNKTWVI